MPFYVANFCAYFDYRIQPNCRTVRIGFSKLLGRLSVVKYVSAYYGYTLKKIREKDLFDDVYQILV